MNQFADRLRFARNLRGLSQSALARECGLSQSAIANYETKTRQSAKNIFVIAHALRVNAAWLAQGIGDMELAPPHSDESASYRLTDAVLSQRADVWPFRTIPSQEFWELSLEQRKIVEQTLASLIRSFQDKPAKR